MLASWHHPPVFRKPAFFSVPRDVSPVMPAPSNRNLGILTSLPKERGEFLFCAPHDVSFYRMMSLDFQSVEREMPFYRLSLHPTPTLLDLLHIFRGNLSPLCLKADQSLVFFIPKPEQAVCFPLVFHPTHCAHSSICPISELRTLWKL